MKTTLFRRFALPFATALISLGSFAATPGVTLLFSNGAKASFTFASKPMMELKDDGLTITSSAASKVTFSFADVEKFYFENDVVQAQISQVENVAPAEYPMFSYADGVVSVRGLSAGDCLDVVSLSGTLVGAVKADGTGEASIDLSSAPAGVYVVSAGSGISFNLLKTEELV